MMKFILKALLQTFWVAVFFAQSLYTRSTLSIVVLGIFGLFFSFGFGIARQVIDEYGEEDE